MDVTALARGFDFVDTVTLERNEGGQIDLKMPQHNYDRSDETPIHQYGWGPFCKFYADTASYQDTAGIYIFTANHQIVYVGESRDVHGRIQAGYSNISPKNCFEGGQQTNCRINTAILEVVRNRGQVAVWASETADRKRREAELIDVCNPPWNVDSPSVPTAHDRQIVRDDNSVAHGTATERGANTTGQRSTGGKYAPFYRYLERTDADEVHLSFDEIEDILDAPLPESARTYEVWWNPTGHPHAEGWAEMGWTADPDLDGCTVTFGTIQ